MDTLASVWITGLGTKYPENLLHPHHLELLAERFYGVQNLK
jgi:hypothetical protein